MNIRTYFLKIISFSLLCLACTHVDASESIGTVIALQGIVNAVAADGNSRSLNLKSEVFLNDKITTDSESKLQIMFNDNSILSQGADSEMTIDEYVYSPGDKENANSGMNFVRGVFRVVTGKITDLNPDRFKVKTRMATIGIRGCEVGFTLRQESEDVFIIGLPSGKSIVIEQAIMPRGTGASGIITKSQVMKIFKPGVVVSLREGQKMTKRTFNVNEARQLINSVSATIEQDDSGQQPKGNTQNPGEPNNPNPGDPNNPNPADSNNPNTGDPNKSPEGDPIMAFFDPHNRHDPNDPGPHNGTGTGPYGPDPHGPIAPNQPSDPNFFRQKPWEEGPDGGFKPPKFDPDDPATWPDDPNFDPNNPETWPIIFFYDPHFDPNDPATWPDDPIFNPDDPATWPRPPLFDPDDPATWPDDPNFDPNNPETWPDPIPDSEDDGGPAADPEADWTFHVLGPTAPASSYWEWGKWLDGNNKLLFPDVFPVDGVGLMGSLKYQELVDDSIAHYMQTPAGGPSVSAAMFSFLDANGNTIKKLMPPGSCDLTLSIGGYTPSTWSGVFNVSEAVAPYDALHFEVISSDTLIDSMGKLKIKAGTQNTSLNYTAKINGTPYSGTSLTYFNIHGEMIGNGLPNDPPVNAIIGWFSFEHGTAAIVDGAFASDLESIAY